MRTARLLLSLCAFPALLGAQLVRGTVTEGATATPVAGAVVLLLDASGVVSARTLTNDRGEYAVAAKAPGTHRLRVLRIGITPTLTEPFALAQDARRNVQLSGRPVQLEAVRVSARSECRVRPDSAQQAFRAWEAVRIALTAAAITESATRPLEVRRTLFRQYYDASGRRLLREERSEATGMAKRPFVAAPAEQLAKQGYVVDSDTGTVYFAPDAETLISEPFADAHCLTVVPAPADTGVRARWIGVAFAPVRGRTLPDVEGTLWVDAQTGELRRLQYRYTNLPEEQDASGRLDFLRLPSGAWIVQDWEIRMPALMREISRPGSMIPTMRSSTTEHERLTRTGIEVTGGDVLEVRDRGRPVWARVRVPLAVRVVQAGTDSGVAGAEVRVEGDGRRVRTGADGRATLDSVLPGTRRLAVRLPIYDSLGLGEVGTEATAGGNEALVSVDVSDRLMVPLCSGVDSAAAAHALAYGVVRDGEGNPIEGAQVHGSWTAGYRRVAGGMLGMRANASATTDAQGRYLLCGLPRGTTVMLQAELPSSGRGKPARVEVGQQWRVSHDITLAGASVAEAAVRDSLDFVPSLRPVVSSAERPGGVGLRGFDERRRTKAGGALYFGREDFRKQNALRPLDVLRGLPGIRVIDSLGVRLVASTRIDRFQMKRPLTGRESPGHEGEGNSYDLGPCMYAVALDGQLQEVTFSIDRIPIEEVYGIEVYHGAAQIPPEFASTRNSATCGLIAVWTRER